jgi:RDD family
MSMHIDPVPREARPFQGHRAGLVTRAAAAAIDVGIVIIASGALYLGITAFDFLLDPRNFSVPTPSPGLVYVVGCLLLIVYLALSWTGNGRTYGNTSWGCASSTGRAEGSIRSRPSLVPPSTSYFRSGCSGCWSVAKTARCRILSCGLL